MAKKRWKPYQLGLLGCGVSLGTYGALVCALAYGLVAGWLPLSVAAVVLCICGFLSVFLGCVGWSGTLGLGAMGGALALWLGFWVALLLVGAGCYGGIVLPENGFALLGATLGGSVAAGLLGRRKKAKRLAKRLR